MAAPIPTARQLPPGYKMPDGFKSTITFSNTPNFNIFEKTVKPPGLDGGEPIDTTTMLNSIWRTKAHRHLVTLEPFTITAAYDPDILNAADITQLLGMINKDQICTVTFPENSTYCFYCFIQKAEFKELKEGEFPELDITVVPTNTDYLTTPSHPVEAAPVFSAAAGT